MSESSGLRSYEVLVELRLNVRVQTDSEESAEEQASSEAFKAIMEAAESGDSSAFSVVSQVIKVDGRAIHGVLPRRVVDEAAASREVLRGLVELPLTALVTEEAVRDMAAIALAGEPLDELVLIPVAVTTDEGLLISVAGKPAHQRDRVPAWVGQ